MLSLYLVHWVAIVLLGIRITWLIYSCCDALPVSAPALDEHTAAAEAYLERAINLGYAERIQQALECITHETT